MVFLFFRVNSFEAHNMNEECTRKQLIDPQLREAGWEILPHSPALSLTNYRSVAITEYPTDNGPADYTLCLDGQLVGVIEAKKQELAAQEVLKQAERYAQGLKGNFQFNGYGVPFLYSASGQSPWFRDVRHSLNRSRTIARFHTPDAIRELLSKNSDDASRQLLAMPNDNKFLRYYQKDANAAVEKAIADRKRQMLVAMATGTGKTFTTVNSIYRLIKSGLAKRILFLVDRRALAAQAVRAFAAYEAEP
ncbi:MAG TPA: hypothetical protein DD726_00180 [Phycisphaerales bacterium]|nr:hypothetical protein [Phycisphaerales bacterium]